MSTFNAASVEADRSILLSPHSASETVTARIKRYRKLRGLAIEELADLCSEFAPDYGLTRVALRDMERKSSPGNRPPRRVTVGDLIVLSAVLAVPIMDLLAESEPTCERCYGEPPAGFDCRLCGASGADMDRMDVTFEPLAEDGVA